MLVKAQLDREIVATVTNKVGILADMSKILSEQGINIKAVAGYAADGEAKIMLVTADNRRTIDALSKKGYKSSENDVVIVEVEDKPGALADITAKLAGANIDIKYIYGTTCPSGCPAQLIFATSDNKKAMAVLK